MLQYTLENHTISKMISDINDYVIDFIMNTLEVEKQHITEKNIPQFLLENLDLSSLFIQVLEKDAGVVSLLNSLLIGISNMMGSSSNVIKKILSDNSGAFVKSIIDLLKKPEVASDTVQFLIGYVLPTIQEIKEDTVFIDTMNSVLISNKESIIALIKSDSVLQCFFGVQIYCAIFSHSIHLLDKELLWDCLDAMFKFPFSSSIHCLISQTIVKMFDSNVEEIINMLLSSPDKFIDRIIDQYSAKNVSTGDFYPHLELIIKSIVHNESANQTLQQHPKWTDFINQSWHKIITLPGNSQIYQPDEDVMRAKERQLLGVRAGRFTPS